MRPRSQWARLGLAAALAGGLVAIVDRPGTTTATVVRTGALPATPAAGLVPTTVRISGGGRRTARATVASAPACPQSTFPVNGVGTYQVAFAASLGSVNIQAGYNEDATKEVDGNHIQGWSATVTNITGTACGLVQVPQLTATVQPANLVINSSQAIIHLFIAGTTFLIQGLTLTLTAVQPLSATVTGVNTDGSVRATAHGVLQAVITGQVPELTCKVTLPAGVTTGTSTKVPLGRSTPTNVPDPWTVTGAAVHGPIIGATGTVVGNDFRVPALPQSKKPTGFNCNLGAVFNEILSGYNKHNVAYRAPFPVTTAPTPAGEVQASAGLTVTSIDLPSVKPCDPGPGLCISAGSP